MPSPRRATRRASAPRPDARDEPVGIEPQRRLRHAGRSRDPDQRDDEAGEQQRQRQTAGEARATSRITPRIRSWRRMSAGGRPCASRSKKSLFSSCSSLATPTQKPSTARTSATSPAAPRAIAVACASGSPGQPPLVRGARRDDELGERRPLRAPAGDRAVARVEIQTSFGVALAGSVRVDRGREPARVGEHECAGCRPARTAAASRRRRSGRRSACPGNRARSSPPMPPGRPGDVGRDDHGHRLPVGWLRAGGRPGAGRCPGRRSGSSRRRPAERRRRRWRASSRASRSARGRPRAAARRDLAGRRCRDLALGLVVGEHESLALGERELDAEHALPARVNRVVRTWASSGRGRASAARSARGRRRRRPTRARRRRAAAPAQESRSVPAGTATPLQARLAARRELPRDRPTAGATRSRSASASADRRRPAGRARSATAPPRRVPASVAVTRTTRVRPARVGSRAVRRRAGSTSFEPSTAV